MTKEDLRKCFHDGKNFNPDRFSKTVSRITSIGSTRAMPSLSSIAVLPLKLKNSGYILEDREC
jgi:hypothetical protein